MKIPMVELNKIYKYNDASVIVIQLNLITDRETKEIDKYKSRVEVSRDISDKWNPFWINYIELK